MICSLNGQRKLAKRIVTSAIIKQEKKGESEMKVITKFNAYMANFHLEGYTVVLRLFAQWDFAMLKELTIDIENEPDFCRSIVNKSVERLRLFLQIYDSAQYFWTNAFEKHSAALSSFFTDLQISQIVKSFENKDISGASLNDLDASEIFSAGFIMMHGGERIDAVSLRNCERIIFHPRRDPVTDFKNANTWGLYAE